MPAVSFVKKAPTVAFEPQPAPSSGAVPSPSVPSMPTIAESVKSAVVASTHPRGLMLGDKIPDFDDIILPRLNIAQQIGELKDTFAPGSIVFNLNTLLFSPPTIDAKSNTISTPASAPIAVVCLGFRPTRYVEKVPGGGRGMIVSSEQAVRDNGGTLDYNEHKLKEKDGMKKFDQLAEALFAIERPEIVADDDNIFVYPVEGKKYALALYGMKGGAFTVAKRVFFTSRLMGNLRQGYPSRYFSLATVWKDYGNNHGGWNPVFTPLSATSPEFLTWAGAVLQAPIAEDTATAIE